MREYDRTHAPPAPVLQATIASVVRRRRPEIVSALLDTGSEVTAVPQALVDALHLYPIGRLQLEGVQAGTTLVLTYAVQITVADLTIPRLEVITTGLDFAVIGRDVLNRLYLALDGPGLTFEIGKDPIRSD